MAGCCWAAWSPRPWASCWWARSPSSAPCWPIIPAFCWGRGGNGYPRRRYWPFSRDSELGLVCHQLAAEGGHVVVVGDEDLVGLPAVEAVCGIDGARARN